MNMKLFQCHAVMVTNNNFPLLAQRAEKYTIFGDSVTAGYGVDPEQAFPSVLQQKIDSAGLHLKS